MRSIGICVLAAGLPSLVCAAASPKFLHDTNPYKAQKRQAYNGQASVYDQDGTTGSCDKEYPNSAMVVALGEYWWNSDGSNDFCSQTVKITNTGPTTDHSIGGKGNIVHAKVVDTCPSCGKDNIDLSWGAWNPLTNNAAASVVGVDWHFCPTNGTSC